MLHKICNIATINETMGTYYVLGGWGWGCGWPGELIYIVTREIRVFDCESRSLHIWNCFLDYLWSSILLRFCIRCCGRIFFLFASSSSSSTIEYTRNKYFSHNFVSILTNKKWMDLLQWFCIVCCFWFSCGWGFHIDNGWFYYYV